MAQLNFDATQHAPNEGAFEAIPAGWYTAYIAESELKPTKDQTGVYLQLTYKIMEGPYKDTTLFARLNISNQNEKAQKIGCGQLSAICQACGMQYVQDSSQLHNIPMKIRVKYIAPNGEYDAQNDIIGFKNANYVPPGTPAAPAGTVPTVSAANPMTNQPWQQPPATVQMPQPQPPVPQFVPTAPVQQQAPVQQPAQYAPQQAPLGQQPWAQPGAPVQADPNQMPQWATAQAPVEQPVQQPVQQPQTQQPPVNTLPGQQATPPWQQ